MAEGRIPLPSIRRFPSYLRILMQKKDAGERDISATLLAHELGLTAIQVRKDLASTGVEGRPKVGFSIEELVVAITHSLGWDNAAEALIIGAGNLGSALAAYNAATSEVKPRVTELQKKLTELRGKIPAEFMEAYLSLRAAKKTPAFVVYDPKSGTCGRCFMEVAGDTKSKLKNPGDYAECPNCRRILYIPE